MIVELPLITGEVLKIHPLPSAKVYRKISLGISHDCKKWGAFLTDDEEMRGRVYLPALWRGGKCVWDISLLQCNRCPHSFAEEWLSGRWMFYGEVRMQPGIRWGCVLGFLARATCKKGEAEYAASVEGE